MSTWLQVLLPEAEMAEIRKVAKREQLAVGEWVRRALREARESKPRLEPAAKLKAVRRAAAYSFPTADIGRMIQEIERGYHE